MGPRNMKPNKPISHEEYLKQKLNSANMKLTEIQTKHRVDFAIYNAEQSLIIKEIDSIDKQLGDHKAAALELDELHKEAKVEDHYKPFRTSYHHEE